MPSEIKRWRRERKEGMIEKEGEDKNQGTKRVKKSKKRLCMASNQGPDKPVSPLWWGPIFYQAFFLYFSKIYPSFFLFRSLQVSSTFKGCPKQPLVISLTPVVFSNLRYIVKKETGSPTQYHPLINLFIRSSLMKGYIFR